VLQRLGEGLCSPEEATRIAVASGHGIGKSALVAWIILWAMSTCPDTRGIVTANTEAQLRTKTWPELAKWLRLAVNGHWFTYTSSALQSALPGRGRTWRVDAVTWSENNTEAIAGLHNKGKRAFAIFDEASAIPDPVWEPSRGRSPTPAPSCSGRRSATRRAAQAAFANASPAAGSLIAGHRARSIRARCR